MSHKFTDLFELTAHDSEAQQYFYSLPNYVQEQISSRADNVNSFASLRDYAENLLRGDN